MLRPGRLDKTLYIGLPTAEERDVILKTITKVSCGLVQTKSTLPHPCTIEMGKLFNFATLSPQNICLQFESEKFSRDLHFAEGKSE